MLTYVALVRGINVGGKRIVPMRELVAFFEEAGADAVETYIQSGNVLFRSPRHVAARVGAWVGSAIGKAYGFTPPILVLGLDALAAAVEQMPFDRGIDPPTAVHVFFLSEAVRDVDRSALDRAMSASERWALWGSCFYLYAPEGVARSKLAVRAEKILGVPATARNWKTVSELLVRARRLDAGA